MFLVISLKEPSTSSSLFEIINENVQSITHFETIHDIKNYHRNYYILVYSMMAKGWSRMHRVVNTDPTCGETTLKEIIEEPMDKLVLELDNDFLYKNENVSDIIRDMKLSLII